MEVVENIYYHYYIFQRYIVPLAHFSYFAYMSSHIKTSYREENYFFSEEGYSKSEIV